ncbi:MAG: DNA-3-methyladenine glycosylase [Verrucomicrobiota bacterium]
MLSAEFNKPFYDRPTLTVARDLLGKQLVFQKEDSWESLLINEVEAYDGPQDKACHAHCGRTKRSEVMFGPAGYWYVYLCYGVHWLANIVVGPEDYPAAVLIRGAGQFDGPGKLTKAIGMTGDANRKKADSASGFFVTDGIKVSKSKIKKTPRIGIDYAGPVWAKKPYRFVLQ